MTLVISQDRTYTFTRFNSRVRIDMDNTHTNVTIKDGLDFFKTMTENYGFKVQSGNPKEFFNERKLA